MSSENVYNNSPFDEFANDYDKLFTHSWIGRKQREQVRNFIERAVDPSVERSVLEINCGTGEDACWLSQKGHTVIASDISASMLEVAKNKKEERKITDLEFIQGDMKTIGNRIKKESIDLIFSNFGGVNCLAPEDLRMMSKSFKQMLNKKGRIVLVVMGRKCAWERVYFKIKGKKEKANRRLAKLPVSVSIGSRVQEVWYYSPKEIVDLFSGEFVSGKIMPIGLFIPPSYLEKALARKGLLKKSLSTLEKLFQNISILSDYADHYLIELKINTNSG